MGGLGGLLFHPSVIMGKAPGVSCLLPCHVQLWRKEKEKGKQAQSSAVVVGGFIPASWWAEWKVWKANQMFRVGEKPVAAELALEGEE